MLVQLTLIFAEHINFLMNESSRAIIKSAISLEWMQHFCLNPFLEQQFKERTHTVHCNLGTVTLLEVVVCCLKYA